MVSIEDREKIRHVRNLIGLNYKFLGRINDIPESRSEVVRLNREGFGIDCYGTLLVVYRFLGFNIKDYFYKHNWYRRNSENGLFDKSYDNNFIKVKDLQVWDSITFKIKSIVPNHIGIYLGEGEFIHCLDNSSVCVSRIAGFWHKLKCDFYRIKDECRS